MTAYTKNTWVDSSTDMKATWLMNQENGCVNLHTEIDAYMPVGSVMMWPNNIPPAGWVLCNGALYGIATYPELYAVIGVGYGSGSGYFAVPDFRGIFPRVKDDGKGYDSGRAVASFQDQAIKNHQHNFTDTIGTGSWSGKSGSSWSAMNASNGADTENTADSGGADGRPKNIALNYIIKYK